MNSKVLIIVALLFAGSASAMEDISGYDLRPQSIGLWKWMTGSAPVVPPTRFARFKQVVLNNKVKTGVVVVATVAVIAAVVAYANSANEVAVEEADENYFV